jgi:hypothetical protein
MKKERRPNPMVTIPSTMKIHAQPGRPARPLSFSIAAASKPPNEPEKAAAEKKIAWDVSLMVSQGIRCTYCSNTKFISLVPAGEEVVDAGKETGFRHPQEPTSGH